MNEVKLMGRIGADLELKFFPSGDPVINFTVYTDSFYLKEGVKVKDSELHHCVATGKNAENIAKFFSKGKPILIDKGRLKSRSYTNKDGVKIPVTEIVVESFMFLLSDPTQSKSMKLMMKVEEKLHHLKIRHLQGIKNNPLNTVKVFSGGF